MFKNYLKMTIRNLVHNKITTIINILGLAIGFTFVILAGRYVYTEKTFDKFHENYDSIYRIETNKPEHGRTCSSPNIMFSWLKDNIPEIKRATRIINDAGFGKRRNIVYNNIKYNINTPLIVDSDFFSIFSFRIMTGEIESFERDKYSIA